MSDITVKVYNPDNLSEMESLYGYCAKLSKRNNRILYLLESYLGKKLLDDHELSEIRDTILTVSADISKLHSHLLIECGDDNEGF